MRRHSDEKVQVLTRTKSLSFDVVTTSIARPNIAGTGNPFPAPKAREGLELEPTAVPSKAGCNNLTQESAQA